MSSLKEICCGLPLNSLPANRGRDPSLPHAPIRTPNLTAEEERVSKVSICYIIKDQYQYILYLCEVKTQEFKDAEHRKTDPFPI